MKKKYIAGLGEILWDMLPSGKKLGGAPANFAWHVAGLGLEGIALSAVGRDALGDEIIRTLDGVHLPHSLQLSAKPTSTVEVSLNPAGVPQYNIVEGVAWDGLRFDDEFARIAPECSCVCFGTLAQRNPVSRECIHAFLDAMPADSLKVFDINLRQSYYSEEVIRKSLEKADVLKINDEELEIVSGMLSYGDALPMDACRRLLSEFGLRFVILTCGTDGSYVVTPDRVLFRETPIVKVVDTVGAGDSFTAAFCAALLKGKSLEEAHSAAVQISAFVCTCNGAMPELPPQLKSLV